MAGSLGVITFVLVVLFFLVVIGWRMGLFGPTIDPEQTEEDDD